MRKPRTKCPHGALFGYEHCAPGKADVCKHAKRCKWWCDYLLPF
jgi:hypothetical protein